MPDRTCQTGRATTTTWNARTKRITIMRMFAERCREVLLARYQDERLVDTAVSNLETVRARFLRSGCADKNFERELKSDDTGKFAQRLGEMLLFERLNHAGFRLTSAGRGPDFRTEMKGEVAWLELVSPSAGEDTRIDELFASHNPLRPDPNAATELRERVLLRICTGISAKLEAFERYLRDGIVKPGQACVIVINDALMCSPTVPFFGVSLGAEEGIGGGPLAEHAVYGVGHRYWQKSEASSQFEIVSTFREQTNNRPEPAKDGSVREPVPVSLFARPTFERPKEFANRAQVISAVMQVTLREDYGVLMQIRAKVEQEDRVGENLLFPGAVIRNPNALVPLAPSIERGLKTMANLPSLSVEEAMELAQRRFAILTGGRYIPPETALNSPST